MLMAGGMGVLVGSGVLVTDGLGIRVGVKVGTGMGVAVGVGSERPQAANKRVRKISAKIRMGDTPC